MISLYLEQETWLHRIAAGRKLLFLCLVSFVLLPVESSTLLSLFLGFVVIMYLSAGQVAVERIMLVKPLLPFLIVILALHVWAESIEEGIAAVLRLLAMILLANLISMTTRMSDMMAALRPVFRPLEILGFSSRRLSIAVALMIRFVPVLFTILESLAESWRARSLKKPRWHLLAPFTLQALKMADGVGDALQSRGGASGIRHQS